jgi:cytochrome c-type biogenesis protein CcmI
MEVALAVLVAVLIGALVAAPLLRGEGDPEPSVDSPVVDLEARREAKYREIRDLEADHAAGKLSEADFERTRAELRAEALAILAELEALAGRQ